MKTVQLSAMVVLAAAGAAQAAIINELENNNTYLTANFIGAFNAPGDGIVVDGSITGGTAQQQTGAPGTAGDVDWFQFSVSGPTQFVAAIYALQNNNPGNPPSAPDSQLILIGSTGNIIAFDDDSNVGFMSSIDTVNLAAGTYYVGVTGYNDTANGTALPDGFETATAHLSGHGENWTYKLTIGLNVVPTPGTAAMMGAGALLALRRKR